MVWYYLKWEESGQNQENNTYNEAKVYIELNKIQIYLLRFSSNEAELENKDYCTAPIDIKYHTGDKPYFTYCDVFGQEIPIETRKLLKF
jgi:hypothetical protein